MIIPGIFEKDIVEIESKIRQVESLATLVQIDVADGELVDGETFSNLDLLGELEIAVSLELHLMVINPLKHLLEKINNVSRVCSQVEAGDVTRDFIGMSKSLGYETGLSLNPGTRLSELEPFIGLIDYIQFMTVVPGGQGRPFDVSVLRKIREFRKSHPIFKVQADGGINKDNLEAVLASGVNDVVIGSAIFKDKSLMDEFLKFRKM